MGLCRRRWPASLVVRVERWNPYARVRQDLLGIGDVLVVTPDETVLIQVSSLQHRAAHRERVSLKPALRLWLQGIRRRFALVCPERGSRRVVWEWAQADPGEIRWTEELWPVTSRRTTSTRARIRTVPYADLR